LEPLLTGSRAFPTVPQLSGRAPPQKKLERIRKGHRDMYGRLGLIDHVDEIPVP
jgi:hypothetical protein